VAARSSTSTSYLKLDAHTQANAVAHWGMNMDRDDFPAPAEALSSRTSWWYRTRIGHVSSIARYSTAKWFAKKTR